MIKTEKFSCNSYYMFESLSSGRSSYFESGEEVKLFKKLFELHLSKHVELHRMYLFTEGYQLLVRTRHRSTILNNFRKKKAKQGKTVNIEYILEPWRVISEQMRIFMSSYVRQVNSMRGREGVLVKSRYNRYFFTDANDLNAYVAERAIHDKKSQRIKRYRVGKKWRKLVNWEKLWQRKSGRCAVYRAFPDLILSKLIRSTFLHHSSLPSQ